jgi:hypothetical protein
MNDKSESAGNFVSDLRAAAARNPVSAALIGMGVLWMLTGARSPTAVGSAFRGAGEGIPDALASVRAGLKERAGAVSDAAASTLNAVGAASFDNFPDYRRAMPDPGAAFDTARESLTELFRSQPLVLGAIGIAIGAGIAAALPKTDIEDDYLGEASQTVKMQASGIIGQQVETVTNLADDVIDAASAEARKQGLTSDGAKAAVADITKRLGRVVDAAKTGVGDG